MENELNTLPPAAEVEEPAPQPTPEPIKEEQEQSPVVDERPDATALEARIKELEERRKKLEGDAKYWREQKAAERARYFKEKQGAADPPPTPAAVGPEPKPNEFDDYDQYIDAKTKYEVRRARTEWEQEAEQRSQNQQIQQKEVELQTKIQLGFTKYADFEDVALHESVPITPAIKDILMDSENPEDVAYYLGKNRSDAIRISRMTPYQAAREIAKIEMHLSATQETPPDGKQTKTTKAPPPIKPIGSAGELARDPEKMSVKEFEKWRIAQGAKPY